MKAIFRNILLACLISTFAFFGAIGAKNSKQTTHSQKVETMQVATSITEEQKETFTCLAVAFLAWALCLWRCAIINKRISKEREYQHRFYEYMQSSSSNRHYY